jgi:hypothetical protein
VHNQSTSHNGTSALVQRTSSVHIAAALARYEGATAALGQCAIERIVEELNVHSNLVASHETLTAELAAKLNDGVWFTSDEAVRLGRQIVDLEARMKQCERELTGEAL